MLSCYRWLIDGKEPLPNALSNVEQHSWLGYYIHAPHVKNEFHDRGSGEMLQASERTLEFRLSRFVGFGLHEDVDLFNYTQEPVEVELQLEIDADFADQEETVRPREQFGDLKRDWRQNQNGVWELSFDYVAHHHYEHQGEVGDPTIHRGIAIEVANPGSVPAFKDGVISFRVSLRPMERWHSCIRMVPHLEGDRLVPLYNCYSFQPTGNIFDVRRHDLLEDSTTFSTAETQTLAPVVVGALEQAKHDLSALRLHDLDQGDGAWTMAAGVPIFVALFGRDTLTASWQSSLVNSEMMQGTLPVLAP